MMFTRLTLAALLATTSLTCARAQPSLPASAEAAGDSVRGCLSFPQPLASGEDAHPGDFVTLTPAVRPAVSAAGGQLCLDGLAYGTQYAVKVRPGLRFADGSRQEEAAQAVIDTPDREPAVAVAGHGWILPRQGATGVTVQTINVPRVRIRVLRLSASQLAARSNAAAAAHGFETGIDSRKQQFTSYDVQSLAESEATEIWSGTMQANAGRNRAVETAFPLAGIVDPAKPGAYLVLAEDAAKPAVKLVRDADDRYDYDTKIAGHWVLSTDLAISSAQGQDGLHVTVRSLGSAAPLPGVRLQLLSLAQDVLGEAVTDAAGAALFAPGLLRGKLGATATILMARTATDMALQDLTAPAFDLSDRGAEGRAVPGPLEAYVYTDRGIYRPGETVQVTALLRTHGLAAVDGAGLTLVLRRPDGVEASRLALSPAPDAGFVQPLTLSKTAAQGSWTIEAYVDPSLPPAGHTTVAVQDFVPQQLKVAVTGPSALDGTAHLTGAIDGRFLYGAPGAGLHAEGDVRLVRDEHPVPDAREYSFGLQGEAILSAPQPLDLADADAVGHVVIDAALQVPDGIGSPLRAVVDAGLTEPGGRAVRQTLSIPLHTHPLLIGVRALFNDRVDAGSPAEFAIRTFDAEGKPVARPGLQWRLVREVTHWDWWRDQASGGGGWTFHTYTTEDDQAQGVVDAPQSEPASLSQAPGWGDYRLIVSDGGTGAATSVRFSVGWGNGSADADVPDQLDVSSDRAVIGIGGTAHIHVRGPFAGPAQVTVESAGRVLDTRSIDLPKGGATFDIPVTAEWGAGVHVLVEAFRPLAAPAGAHDPVRAMGLAWIAADPAPHTLAVSIAQPGVVTPRQTLAVPVHVAGAHGRAFVTLAAVDEGILQLTRFASPDPVAALLGRTRIGLDLRDDYGRLLDGHADAGALQEGGDEGAALGGQGLPVTTTQVVALFHDPVELDAEGNATIPLDLPDFAGELRLMAVAYDHDAAGHAEAALTVRDPVVAELSLPRFLAPGDVAEVGVSLHDTDGPAGTYHLAVTATGAAGLHGVGELDATLGQGERKEARLELAGAAAGIGHVTAVLTGPGGISVTHAWDITVRSPHPDLVLSRTETQRPGEDYRPDPALLAAFVPGSAQLTIGYSAQANIDVPGLLQSLYTYPFGCTEQLSSSALPLLYFNDARLLGHSASDPGVHARVQDAIGTIADRQDAAGRFGLWHVGDGAGPVWVNVYALDFLLRAREAGFAVPDRVTTRSAQWIDAQLDREDADWNGADAEPAQPTRAYAAYVLARTGRVDPARLRTLASTLDGQVAPVSWRRGGLAAPLSLAQLAGAQALMGVPADATFAAAVGSLGEAAPDSWSNAYFWSELRDEAGVLAVAAETGHDDVAATLLQRLGLQRLGQQKLQPSQMNTQEKAWLLMAAHALGKRGATRTLSIGGGAPGPITLPYAVSATPDDLARGVSVRNAGTDPVFRTVTVRGAPTEAPPAMAAGFQVRRDTYSLSGQALDDTALRQTDRFLVVLSGRVADGAFRRAVVTDPLPAGLEIEAPVLRADDYKFIGQLTDLRAHEERDDRFIAAFDIGQDAHRWTQVDDDKPGALEPAEFRVAYLVRAVTPGRFVRPETVVEDMYHPDVMARTAGSAITVAPR